MRYEIGDTREIDGVTFTLQEFGYIYYQTQQREYAIRAVRRSIESLGGVIERPHPFPAGWLTSDEYGDVCIHEGDRPLSHPWDSSAAYTWAWVPVHPDE